MYKERPHSVTQPPDTNAVSTDECEFPDKTNVTGNSMNVSKCFLTAGKVPDRQTVTRGPH